MLTNKIVDCVMSSMHKLYSKSTKDVVTESTTLITVESITQQQLFYSHYKVNQC